MSRKLAATITVEFTTTQFSTGAAFDATGTPTGTVYKNGTADALSVTVTNQATGEYKAVFTPSTGAGFAAGDNIALMISATVDSVAAKGVVFEDILQAADLDDVHSDTTIIASDCLVIESQTTKILSDSTAIHSQTTVIASDCLVIESQTTKILSDTSAIHLQTTQIASDCVVIESQTTNILSDTSAIHLQTTQIASDCVVIESQTTKILSDTTAIHSDTDWLYDVAEGDNEIDTSGSPWNLVVKRKSTETELIRKNLYKTDDSAVGGVDDVVSQELEGSP